MFHIVRMLPFCFPPLSHNLFVSLSTTIETKGFVQLCSFGKNSAVFLVNLILTIGKVLVVKSL